MRLVSSQITWQMLHDEASTCPPKEADPATSIHACSGASKYSGQRLGMGNREGLWHFITAVPTMQLTSESNGMPGASHEQKAQ